MDPLLAKMFRDRWNAVEAIEQEEQRCTSMDQRWLQLNYLYGLGLVLGLLHEDRSDEIVWQRWAKLKSDM